MSFLMNLDLIAIIAGSAAGIVLLTLVTLFACYYMKKNEKLVKSESKEKGNKT